MSHCMSAQPVCVLIVSLALVCRLVGHTFVNCTIVNSCNKYSDTNMIKTLCKHKQCHGGSMSSSFQEEFGEIQLNRMKL